MRLPRCPKLLRRATVGGVIQRELLDTRLAARRALAGIASAAGPGARPLVLVALSGGADSLALAAAVAHEARGAGVRAGAVVIDHQLQSGSAAVAARADEAARLLGLDPVLQERVDVSGAGGPEAAARDARYAALEAAALRLGAAAVLTAHTRDDQAEQVLLGLARGSGLRSLAGIPSERLLAGGVALVRPFLREKPAIVRTTTERACEQQGLEFWRDPHNVDTQFTRVRVRTEVLPELERQLGPGVAAALARTADLAREDAAALEQWAEAAAALFVPAGNGSFAAPIASLRVLPAAVLQRAVRRVAKEAFGAHLGREHALAITALVTDWSGQGPVSVPGTRAQRLDGELVLAAQAGSPRRR